MKTITFDIEDWYNHDDYSRDFDWDKHEVRIYEGTDKILEALDERNMKATCFCVGWLAEKHPAVIKKIADAGHHIGCHAYQHELATRFTQQEFHDDTYKAKCLLEDVSGQKVDAFRVPSFSLTKSNLWLFDELAKMGFVYDSSIFPSTHEFGGIPGFPAEPSIIKTEFGKLKEFPICLGKILGREIIYSGGGYFRVMPYCITKKLTMQNDYVLGYFHPSDFDPEQPNMPQLSWMRQFKNRVGLKGAYKKFKKYINDFDFINLPTADERIDWNEVKVYTKEDLNMM